MVGRPRCFCVCAPKFAVAGATLHTSRLDVMISGSPPGEFMDTCSRTFAGLDKLGMRWCGLQTDRGHFLTREDKPESTDSPEVAREEEFAQQLGQMATFLIGYRLRRRLASIGALPPLWQGRRAQIPTHHAPPPPTTASQHRPRFVSGHLREGTLA